MEYLGRGTYRLQTGRAFSAYSGILGISPETLSEGVLYEGSDAVVEESEPDTYPEHLPFTPEERVEIADYTIALWERWKTATATPERT